MLDHIGAEIRKRSDEAEKIGNKFPGYFGKLTQDFSKDELIMLLNIIYSELQSAKDKLLQKDKL